MSENDINKLLKEGKGKESVGHTNIGIASIVFGLISIILMFIPLIGFLAIPLSIFTIIIGYMARRKGDFYGLVGLVIGIIVLIIVIATTIFTAYVYMNFMSDTQDTGESFVQQLIYDASPGDTITIPSGIYNEHICIGKPITLIGENKNNTFIDSISILADSVSVSGFTIKGEYHGIYVYAYYNTNISGNNILNNNEQGIYLSGSENTIISGNVISGNGMDGIYLSCSKNNRIRKNIISNNFNDGICLDISCNHNVVSNNTISSNSGYGIYIADNSNSYNAPENNEMYHNNFLNNEKANARSNNENNYWYNSDLMEGNYWDDYNWEDNDGDGIGDNPYSIISGMDHQDKYPLVNLVDI